MGSLTILYEVAAREGVLYEWGLDAADSARRMKGFLSSLATGQR